MARKKTTEERSEAIAKYKRMIEQLQREQRAADKAVKVAEAKTRAHVGLIFVGQLAKDLQCSVFEIDYEAVREALRNTPDRGRLVIRGRGADEAKKAITATDKAERKAPQNGTTATQGVGQPTGTVGHMSTDMDGGGFMDQMF